MIINTISDIKKIVLEIALFTLALSALLYVLLLNGVEIPKISLGSLHISKLYLKLDKKLILNIDRIELPQTKTKSQLPEQIAYIDAVGKYFQHIAIKNLKIGDEIFSISYKDGLFTAKSKDLEATLKLHYDAKLQRLIANVVNVENKKMNLQLQGMVRIYKKHRIFAILDYRIEGIEGKLKLLKKGDELTFWLNSKPFSNTQLKKLFSHIRLHPLIKAWSYQKIKARRYRLLYTKGKIDLKAIDPRKIEAKAVGENVKVWFQKGIDPVHIQKVTLLYKNDNLFFTLQKPRFHDKDLTGSKVRIYHLTNSNSFIDVDLKTLAPLDEDIRKIVASYGIKLPLLQKRGSIDAQLLIRVIFKNRKVHLKGEFYTENALFDLDGIDLQADKLFVKLIDHRLVIKHSRLALPPYIKAKVQGSIDLVQKKGKLFLDEGVVKVAFKDQPLLAIDDFRDTLLIDIRNHTITLPSLNLRYHIQEKKLFVEHAQDLKNYSPILQTLNPQTMSITLDIPKGKATVSFVKDPSPFSKKQPITKFFLAIDMKRGFATLNDFATIDFTKEPKIRLREVTLDLTKLPKKGAKSSAYTITFENMTLRFENHRLFIKHGKLRNNPKSLSLNAQLKRGKLFVKKDSNLTIIATNLEAQTLNQLIGKKIFHQGSYSIEARGDEKELKGTLRITNGYLKDLKLINNFFAFLNTIPALMTLSDPGYDKTGLLVKKGTIDFLYSDKKLIFPAIKLRSISMDIVGNGIIDLEKKSIKLQLELQTLKNVASLIKNIPLAGYILLGKDGTISTAVEVYGALEDPKFRSLLPSQTIKMPFKIIKRTLELPFKLFE